MRSVERIYLIFAADLDFAQGYVHCEEQII